MSRGPFVRWDDLPGRKIPTNTQSGPGRGISVPWIKNTSGIDLPRWSVLQIDGSVITPADDDDQYQSRILLVGDTPDADESEKFGILQQHIEDGACGAVLLNGVSFVRLVGQADGTHCGVKSGENTLISGSGPCAILYDPGPPDPETDDEAERIAIVRFGGSGGKCEEVHQFMIFGTPTSGAAKIGYRLDRYPNVAPAEVYDDIAFDYNETSASFETKLLGHAIGDLTTADVRVQGGPWPDTAIEVIWQGDFGGRAIAHPSNNPNTLNNGAKVKMHVASSADWKGY